MQNIPDRALINWIQPGLLQSRVWWYHDNVLQTIAQRHEANTGSVITYDGNIEAGENVTQGPDYHLINDAIWQWLTKEEAGPFKRKEGYDYLKMLYEGRTMQELMTLFEETTTGSDTEGLDTDGEGKEPVELTDKLNIKF